MSYDINDSAVHTKYMLATFYGCGIGVYDPTPIVWAANRVAEVHGWDHALNEIKTINCWRRRMGLPLTNAFPSTLTTAGGVA
jgi:hypothetical protein